MLMFPALLLAAAFVLGPEQPVAPPTFGAVPYNHAPVVTATTHGYFAAWLYRTPFQGPRELGTIEVMPFTTSNTVALLKPLQLDATNALPAVASSGDDVLLAWDNGGGIGARHLSPNGDRVGSTQTVLPPAGAPLAQAHAVWNGRHYVVMTGNRGAIVGGPQFILGGSVIDAAAAGTMTLALTLDSGVLKMQVIGDDGSAGDPVAIATNVTTAGVAASDTAFLLMWKSAGREFTAGVDFTWRVSPADEIGAATNVAQPSGAWNGERFHVEWDGGDIAAADGLFAQVQDDNSVVTARLSEADAPALVLSRMPQLQWAPHFAGDMLIYAVSPIGATGGIRVAIDGRIRYVTDDAVTFDVAAHADGSATVLWVSSDHHVHAAWVEADGTVGSEIFSDAADDAPIAIASDGRIALAVYRQNVNTLTSVRLTRGGAIDARRVADVAQPPRRLFAEWTGSEFQVVWSEGTDPFGGVLIERATVGADGTRTPPALIATLPADAELQAVAGPLAVYTRLTPNGETELRAFRLDAPHDDARLSTAAGAIEAVTIVPSAGEYEVLWPAYDGIHATRVDASLSTPSTTMLLASSFGPLRAAYTPRLTAMAYTNAQGLLVVRSISVPRRARAAR